MRARTGHAHTPSRLVRARAHTPIVRSPAALQAEAEQSGGGKRKSGMPQQQAARKEGTGLLDEEPDRAETDFYNGDKYVGDVTNSKRHGHGVYYYDSGDKYTGNWETGKQNGHGVYVYANGDRYVGDWSGGKHNGSGAYYFKSGKVFQGFYRDGQPTGHGVFVYTNGEKLDGEWNGEAQTHAHLTSRVCMCT